MSVEISNGWSFSERFPDQPEILRYFAYMDKQLNLSKDVFFNSRVASAAFDPISSRWNVNLHTGRRINCQFLVLATGYASRIHIPDFSGIQRFKGKLIHTSAWPKDEKVEVKGKKVAVFGTGSSGVQIIQEIAKDVENLVVFQRTPNLCLPMQQSKFDPKVEAEKQAEGYYKTLFEFNRNTFAGIAFDFNGRRGDDDTPEQRREEFERLWYLGGFRFWLGGYVDLIFSKKTNDYAYEFWAEKTRSRIHDPKKRDILAPTLEKQPHT
jgi:cation diffusion facilitator CzcD-associated flavoprotein CzcO